MSSTSLKTNQKPQAVVAVGDLLRLSWPENGVVTDRTCRVLKIITCDDCKYNSFYKYKLAFLNDNDNTEEDDSEHVNTRLLHLTWEPLSKKSKAKTAVPSSLSSNSKPSTIKKLPPHKYILAPMVGASELPFRLLCRKYGAQLAYTPMMNSERFAVDEEYRQQEFQSTPSDRPLVAHFSANRPEHLLAAAKLVESRCDAIDLNLGCPQRVACAGHFGSFLLDEADRDLVLSIVRTTSSNISIPMFVKIRLLNTLEETTRLCFQLAEAGASLIAIHARHRVNLVARSGPGARDGPALLEQVTVIKQAFLQSSRFAHIPIIANGNVRDWQDVQTNLTTTAANGIMSAEGILDNPALFAPAATTTTTTSNNEVDEMKLKKRKTTTSSSLQENDNNNNVNKVELALEYLSLVASLAPQYPTTTKSQVFHIRRMLRDELTRYDMTEECLACNNNEQLQTLVLAIKKYETTGGFQLDKEKQRKAKEAMDRLKQQQQRRKEFEQRMIRKAKRAGLPLDHYLNIGAELPTPERLQELRRLTHEECFNEWKKRHQQHCFALHMHHLPGVNKCDRDRTCAFLHVDIVEPTTTAATTAANDEQEIFG